MKKTLAGQMEKQKRQFAGRNVMEDIFLAEAKEIGVKMPAM
jgi:hypothetical protein